ncbi:AAA family ATPase [Streptomyces sp. CG1]|uniref:helix-turn-helix transcriptional regulator n=1 Tax=Streptomyces sp. CG1 TaxID=1287523 RepID=UPI0034E1D4A5
MFVCGVGVGGDKRRTILCRAVPWFFFGFPFHGHPRFPIRCPMCARAISEEEFSDGPGHSGVRQTPPTASRAQISLDDHYTRVYYGETVLRGSRDNVTGAFRTTLRGLFDMAVAPSEKLPFPLLERDVEVRQIERLIRQLHGGHGGVLAIEGSSGLGRSSLLELLLHRASEAGFCVLYARGNEFEGDMPFGAVAQLLESAGQGLGDAAATVPVRAAEGFDPQAAASPAVLGRLRRDLLELAGHRRLVVVVDDARWADVPSLRFLSYMGARAERTPVLLAVALDPADRGPAVDWLGGVSASLETTLLRLGPLSDRATRRLVSMTLGTAGSDDLARACFDATGGNPLLLHEVLAEVATGRSGTPEETLSRLSWRPPGRVLRQMVRRLQSLPGSSLAVARAVAVLGVAEDPVVVSQTADCAEADVDDAVTALVDAEVMTDTPALRFAQPMLRTAVYAGIPAFVRGRLHARAARALAETGASSQAVAEQLVNVPLATKELIEPHQGSGVWSRTRMWRAIGHLRQGRPKNPSVPGSAMKAAERAGMALDVARTLTLDGQFDQAITILGTAIAEVCDPDLTPRLEATAIWIAQLSPDTRDHGRERLEQLRKRAAKRNPVRPHLAEHALLDQFWRGAPGDHIGRLADDLLNRPRIPAGDSIGWSVGLVAAVMLAHFDRLPEARQAVLTLRDTANQTDTTLAGLDLCLRAALDYQLGDIAGAGDLALLVLSGTDGQRPPRMVQAFAAAVRAETLIEQGALDAAAAALEDPDLIDTDGAETIAVLPLLRARGRLRITQGQLEQALDDLLRGRRITTDLGLSPGAGVSWTSAVTALHRLGRIEEALSIAREDLAEARSFGAPGPLAAALRTLGLLTPGPAGLSLVQEAAGLMEDFPGRLELARTLMAYGIVLRRVGKGGAAREQLRLAAETAAVHGAHVLHRRAMEELRAIDTETAGRRSRSVLTPRQQRVAELAAEGMQNEEIAQKLFVTVKTVEWHLTQAYRKLGIESRSALAPALAATTLDYAESA